MDFEALTISIYVLAGGTVLFSLVRFFIKPKICAVCGIETEDEYRDKDDKCVPLCKNHLIERWKEGVVSSPYTMAAIEPDFVKYPHAYLYATVARLKEWNYKKEDQDAVSAILDSVEGKMCNICGSRATVAYFNKEDFISPFFAKISAQPTFLCKGCFVKRVEQFLSDSSLDFGEGLYAPTNDKGVFHVLEFHAYSKIW